MSDLLYDILHMAMERTKHMARASAHNTLSLVFQDELFPAKVVDFGCGRGDWLKAAEVLGAKEVLGVEPFGDIAGDIGVPRTTHDLTVPWEYPTRFNLAICMEVGEHIDSNSTDVLVKSLVDAADIIVWSAAVPGQGGIHHINEQPPAYWSDKFKSLGYECYDFRTLWWNNTEIEPWYKQNCLVFSTPGNILFKNKQQYKVAQPLHLIHPELFQGHSERTRNEHVVWDYVDGRWQPSYIPKA